MQSDYPDHLRRPQNEEGPFKQSAAFQEPPKTYDDIDNQVLPALKANAGANNPPEYAPGEEFNEEEAKNGEPISASNRSAAAPLINVFGEPVVRMIFSRTWALREKGID